MLPTFLGRKAKTRHIVTCGGVQTVTTVEVVVVRERSWEILRLAPQFRGWIPLRGLVRDRFIVVAPPSLKRRHRWH
jgi:hypothetical protein